MKKKERREGRAEVTRTGKTSRHTFYVPFSNTLVHTHYIFLFYETPSALRTPEARQEDNGAEGKPAWVQELAKPSHPSFPIPITTADPDAWYHARLHRRCPGESILVRYVAIRSTE
ncbi:hypothetical protein E2C01_016043 [Portunus trituberculatus]|uniref:Uncharacterized protein n=1 Tax=Portunus trituberculatus TaxID=210409 RepID=A0A5B7DPJ7_PORTR|nr:hypothetical protein [Portunus trituberculatus]